jgi:hypothetical protein
VQVWLRDDGVLDAGQSDALTCVRRVYMWFDIALTVMGRGRGVLRDACFYPRRLQRE